ncbi:helix-turn-helix domain-containing protein [Nocardia zapadnayensis]|nr:helix-turn-helix domain-containing protein [Nocardia zapadnayensis]MCX0274750.1 helix-turn-helix domain-containing protein [Nocardia zapadnayensis]
MSEQVKRAFKYRFYPTDTQAVELERTFGCVRKVYNLALDARTVAWTRGERVNYAATSAMLTEWKRSDEFAYLGEVSSVPLQQALRRWFPSSKLCSVCGALRESVPLRVREWTCGCGVTHDRDVNAAKNIVAAGLAVSVCGDGVRPQRSTPGGRPSVKQKTRPARVGILAL